MKQPVYDLPTRLFHWLFATLFLTAFIIAKNIDVDTNLFNFHSLAGLTIFFLVLQRIIWGFWGTKHARFSDFSLKPRELVEYFKGILTGQKKRWAGHNPASSWAAIVMMLLALGLSITGYFMTSGPDKETYEDVHEIFANGFMITVLLHISGIIIHTLRYKEMIGLSMLDGKKSQISSDQVIQQPRTGVAVLFMGLVFAFGLYLYKNYDHINQRLNFFGTTLQLGEGEAGTDTSIEKEGAVNSENVLDMELEHKNKLNNENEH